MNANLLHNILNVIGLVVGALLAFDWQGLGLSPELAASIAASVLLADKVIKFAINITRDGLAGLWMPQPPVQRRR
jgi:hypothetical protein